MIEINLLKIISNLPMLKKMEIILFAYNIIMRMVVIVLFMNVSYLTRQHHAHIILLERNCIIYLA